MTREDRRRQLHAWSLNQAVGLDMRPFLNLDAEFPDVGLCGPDSSPSSVGPGWVPLLRPVVEALASAGCRTRQVKQKFCELVVYWDIPSGVALSRGIRNEIKELIERAREASLHTCESCGGPDDGPSAGRIRTGTRLCRECQGG